MRQLKPFYVALSVVLVAGGLVCLLVGVISVGIGMLAAAVVAPLTGPLVIRHLVARRLTYLCVPATVRVTGDGYEVRTEQHTTSMKWSMVNQVVTTPEFWLLYTNKLFMAFLPKAAFDDEQRAELEVFFAARQNAQAT
ncbi:MAG: YcxB family protein [Actinomadura sp.]